MPDVEFRWKEAVIYWEDDRGFVFEGGWGADPLETYVPDDARWDEVVPTWLRGRRGEVIARLKERPGHIVRDDPGFIADPEREVFRA